jgi:hypothetical protein
MSQRLKERREMKRELVATENLRPVREGVLNWRLPPQ